MKVKVLSVLVLLFALLSSAPAGAEEGTFARGYPQSLWPQVADTARVSQLASKGLQDVLRELFRTGEGTYQDGCLSNGFRCVAGTGFNVNVSAGLCLYSYATGADAEHSAYRVLQLGAAEAATAWAVNPGAGTYYVHVAYGEATADGIEAPDPTYTIDANATLAGTYTPCSIVVGGGEPSAATYTYADLRTVLNGTHYAPTATGGGVPRVLSYRVNSAGERTAGEHAIGVLPATAVVTDVWVYVDTQEVSGTTTVKIGRTGDTDGYADGLSVAASAMLRPGVALDGTGVWYATATRGTALAKLIAGSAADDRGLYYEFPDLGSAGTTVSYTVPAGGWTEAVVDVYVHYVELVQP